jgi:Integral membrane protein EMC3/TMCO1-like
MSSTQSLFLDPALRDWVLFPIFIVMIMVGIIRHYATILLQSAPKPEPLKAIREQYVFRQQSNVDVPLAVLNSYDRMQTISRSPHLIPAESSFKSLFKKANI